MKNWFAVIGFVVVALVVGVCVACTNDDDDDSLPVLVQSRKERSGDHGRERRENRECRRHCSSSGDGDRSGNNYCVMPCDFVIIIPPGLVPGQGGDGGEEMALTPPPIADPRCFPWHCDPHPQSLMPPDPAKLVESIRVMTQGVGEAAGALAGAIAGGTIGILLAA